MSNPRVWCSSRQPYVPAIPAAARIAGTYGGLISSDQWDRRLKLSRKIFHRVSGQCDLNGSSLQVVEARVGHWVFDNTTVDQNGLPPLPRSQSFIAVADKLASRKAGLELRNVSLKRQI
jgi:hypothetical protein